MPDDKLVLVTGATGRQGGATARHLLDAGFPVRILTRNAQSPRAVALREHGAEVREGDMENAASLERALDGAYGVFSVQNYWEKGVGADGEIRQARNLIDASRSAGVRHFVQASVADAERAPGVEHFECKVEIERHLERSGMPYTILGEVFYLDNFLDPKGGALMFPVLSSTLWKRTRLHMIATEDIGAIAAHVFRHPEEFVGRKIDVAGDVLSVDEMRAVYQRVTGKKPKKWSVPEFMVKLFFAEMHRQLRWNNQPGWRFSLDETRRIVPSPTTFEAFVRKHGVSNL